MKKYLTESSARKEAIEQDVLTDNFSPSDSPNIKTKDVIYSLFESKKGLGYVDLSGCFPNKSVEGEITH